MYFCEYFEKFLFGRAFTLKSIHQNLATLLQNATCKRQSAKFNRWNERLAASDFKFEYQKGINNIVPDALSRLIDEPYDALTEETAAKLRKIQFEQGLSAQVFKKSTEEDDVLKHVMKFIENRWPNSPKQLDYELRPFFKLRHDLENENG